MEEWDLPWAWRVQFCKWAKIHWYKICYLGDYENGIKHGYGTFYYLNNRKYEGEWRNGKQNGQGKLSINDSVVYEGNFKDG